MLDMCAVIESRQVADEGDAPNRSPADVIDQAVIGLGGGRNHHGAARVLAVVEGEEQTRSAINLSFSVSAQRKRAAAKTSQANKDGCLVSHLSPTAESA